MQMLLSKTVIQRWHRRTKKHYVDKGYTFTKMKEDFEVKVEDLTYGSEVYVNAICDICGENISLKWIDYVKNTKHNNGIYCCRDCIIMPFEKWCVENNRQDVLNRWDIIANNGKKPNDISTQTSIKYYFKCDKHPEHKSELKNIRSFTIGHEGSIQCNKCNSFAQWGIDNFGEDFLNKYWSDKNTVNPWEITKSCSTRKVWIKCQEKEYHDSYAITCSNFYIGYRCSYCGNQKVHPFDSLGQYIVDNYGEEFLNNIWSDKNIKSAFEYTPMSNKKAWFKCSNNKHDDYFRYISDSNNYKFRCPSCHFSKGETRIEKWLKDNNFIEEKDYIPQKEFDGLLGLGDGELSYDFYLPQYNLLIEYQGEFHDGDGGRGNYFMKQNLKVQKEHDRRKKQYCIDNNIKLLEIWYWDFDNIEEILNNNFQGGDLL